MQPKRSHGKSDLMTVKDLYTYLNMDVADSTKTYVKRLEKAYYRIKEKRQKPSDFYLDIGF